MPYRKTYPGLDAKIDAFIEGVPLTLEEPPARIWPTAILTGTSGLTVGLFIGVAIADHVSAMQVLAVVLALVTAVVAVVWFDYRDDRDDQDRQK